MTWSSKARVATRHKMATLKSNPYFLTESEFNILSQLDEIEIRFSAKMDEFWSFEKR
jgi:hypothetical protein